ncbi:uncharacterized protein LOC133887882 [Phragmites australis]|uniref:uncharacterized protein LOC133887882 n=1 Tax=Phragmites australis TaxID=29695 RepID=UPI002D792475|nr:uncharacterized protein LOC133887882 [Phragmites australis]XP_062183879.1 uncharacterized protein LOC133887882 [Phragmites australis]
MSATSAEIPLARWNVPAKPGTPHHTPLPSGESLIPLLPSRPSVSQSHPTVPASLPRAPRSYQPHPPRPTSRPSSDTHITCQATCSLSLFLFLSLAEGAAMWTRGSPGRLPAMEECSEDGDADADVDMYRRTSGAMASCWGRFGVAALWRRLRQQLSLARRRRRHGRSILGAGGPNYDLLSYAQNFDDGGLEEREAPNFTIRFAPPRHAVSPRRAAAAPDAVAA